VKTTADLLALHERITNEARGLMKAKNEDYAHGADPFRNFRRHGPFGVLVRLSDKIARLDSFEERGEFSVQSEGLEDTVKDIINYATIYLALKREAADGSTENRAKAYGNGPAALSRPGLAERLRRAASDPMNDANDRF